MPIFEYKCKKCGSAFEALVSNAATKPECESCGSMEVEKQLSTFSPSVASASSPCADFGCGRAGTGCAGACPTE